MIEDEFAPVPPGQPHVYRSESGHKQTVRQHPGLIIDAHSPVHAANRDQYHGRYGVGPACDAHADSRNQEKLCGANQARADPRGEGNPRRPKSRTNPKHITIEPEQKVTAQGRHHEGNREMHGHGMQGVTGYGDARTRILGCDLLNHRAGAVRFAHRCLRPVKRFSVPIIFAGFAVTGCSGSHSTLDPAGPSAQAIATLWWIMLGGSAAIFVSTSAALVVAWSRPSTFGARPYRLLITWGGLVLPCIILVSLLISAFVLGERLVTAFGSAAPLRIEAEGRQWQWEFRYPEAAGSVTTLDILHIPAGREVELTVTGIDVIHSFWVPRLGGKIDVIPGHRNKIRLMAEKPGSYGGVCAEFCGIGHSQMRFTVVAHTAEEYGAALSRSANGYEP